MKVEQDIEICGAHRTKRKRVRARFDSKVVALYIDEKVAKGMGEIHDNDTKREAFIYGERLPFVGSISIDVIMEGCELGFMARIVRNLKIPVVIGWVFMEEYGVELKKGVAKLKQVPPEMILI